MELLPVRMSSLFDVEQQNVRSLQDLYERLCRLQEDPKRFVIRGVLAPDRPVKGVRRTSRANSDQPANFAACSRQWLMVDLDGIPLPSEWQDFEQHTPEILDHVVSLLPPEFAGVAFAYQWSGSMGFKNDEIRLHLWFWLDNPVSDQEAKAWLQETPVDLSVFNAVQPHFTAAPILENGVKDPVVKRLGLHNPSGFRLSVQPPSDLSDRALRPRHCQHRSDTDRLDVQGIIRDPDTGLVIDGRERFMLLKSNDATCELMRGRSKKGDFPDLTEIADLTWELFSAEADVSDNKWSYSHALSEAERRRDELKTERYSFQSRADTTMLLPACEPFTRLSPVDASQGQNRLNSALTDFFAEIEHSPRLALRITTGAGKTYSTLKHLRNYLASSLGKTVEVYVPRHDLAEQYVQEIERLGGFNAEVIHVMPRTGGPRRELPVLCDRPDYVRGLEQEGLSVYGNACSADDGEKCAYFDSCRYLKQFRDVDVSTDNHGNVVRIMVHQYLRLPRNQLMSRPDLVVIDEAFFNEVVDTQTEIPLHEIRTHIRTGNIPDLGRKISNALEDGEPLLKSLRSEGIHPSDLEEVRLDHLLPSFPFEPERQSKPKTTGDPVLFRSLKTLLRILREEMRLQPHRDEVPRIVYALSRKSGQVARLAYVQGLLIPENCAVLCLDATADHRLLEPLLGAVDLERIDVKQNAGIVQVYDRTGSKAHWNGPTGDVEKLAEVLNTWAEFGEPPLVVSHKDLADKLRESDDIASDVKINHFAALRGSNDAEDCSAIFIAGRNMPPPFEVDLKARALFWDDEEPLQHDAAARPSGLSEPSERLPVQLRGYVQSSRNPMPQSGVMVPSFSDHRIEAIHAQIRDAETMQAIGRLRLVHSPYRKRVFLLSNLPVEVEVDELVAFDELMPDRLEMEMMRKGNIPLTPLGLMKMRPDLASSKATAEKLLQRSCIGDVDFLRAGPELIATGAVVLSFKAENAGRRRTHRHLFLLGNHSGQREPHLNHGLTSVGHFSLDRAVRFLEEGDPQVEGSGWAGVSDPQIEEVFNSDAP
ncbi:DEAD/DEAH box helicase family protein [Phaeobacter gallaeciensis]|uniref:DEAD/DEAH box helicase family protein n=1 Tax=Phaeobacter gallaeciensis TaxID=60890 RepID=UPI0018D3431E|nr:DEAD/DEAH box helicase family protein [Phaeobacter gallaeciensis]